MDALQLNDADFTLIMEALDSHESKAASNKLSSMLLGAMLCPPDKRDEFKADMTRENRDEDAKARILKVRVALVRAKLIMLRDSAAADAVTRVSA